MPSIERGLPPLKLACSYKVECLQVWKGGLFPLFVTSGFIFYVFRDVPDIYFLLTGVQTSFPDKSKSPPQFLIDGVFYQTLLVRPSQFMKVEKGVTDLDILKQHQKYEWDFMQKTPTPLRKLDELGPRVKPASNGQPSFTFYLWAAVDPKDAQRLKTIFSDHCFSFRRCCSKCDGS